MRKPLGLLGEANSITGMIKIHRNDEICLELQSNALDMNHAAFHGGLDITLIQSHQRAFDMGIEAAKEAIIEDLLAVFD
jgi:hypothetical protein